MNRIHNLLRQNASTVLFFIFYTAVFYILSKLIWLFVPLLLGILLYFLVYPVCRFFQQRLHLSVKLSTYTVSILCFLLLISLFVLLIILLCRETVHLLHGESYFRFDELLPPVQDFLKKIFSRIPTVTEKMTNDLSGTVSTLLPYAGSTLKLFLSVPAVLILPALAFTFTILFLLHRHKLRHFLSMAVGPKEYLRLRHTIKKQSRNSPGFVFSYALIYLITFAEACIVLSLLNMPYPLITAMIVTVSDIFPILGPGAVLLPLCIYRLLCGAYAQTIGLLAGWLLITVIRQIIEPKLISKISRTPAIVMLTAVYASLIFGNFWIIPYTALLFYLYRLFSDAGMLSQNKQTSSASE